MAGNRSVLSEALLASIKADEARLQEIAVLKTHIINYAKSKEVFAKYKTSGYSRDFCEAHREALTLHRAASKAFREYEQQHPSPDGEKVKLPTVKQLSAEYAEVLARKKQSYSEYRKGKDEMRDYLTAQKIIETMFGKECRQEDQHPNKHSTGVGTAGPCLRKLLRGLFNLYDVSSL